jgi:hypothetical protein
MVFGESRISGFNQVICTPEGSWGNGSVARDSIVDEVRRVREDLDARHGFDVKAILAASKRQRWSTYKVVSFVPKKKLSA